MARTKVKIEMDAELEGMFDGFGVKAASKAASALKKANYLKLGPGRHIIRVLPARKGATSPFSEVWQHMIKPPGGKMFSINCPQKTNGTHCPVCAKVDELRNSDIEADKALGKDMQAKMQISCNAIVRKSDGTEGEIGLLRIPRGVYEKMLELGKDADVVREYEDDDGNVPEYVDMTHPLHGFDIRLDKSGTGLKTEYVVKDAARSHNTPALKDVARLKEVLKAMVDLDSLGKILSENEINLALTGPANGGGETPALTERTAERAAHDPIDASASDEDDDGKDEDGIPF